MGPALGGRSRVGVSMTQFLLSVVTDRRFFPSCLILLDVCAAGRYALCSGEWRKVVYWLAAAALTSVVTW